MFGSGGKVGCQISKDFIFWGSKSHTPFCAPVSYPDYYYYLLLRSYIKYIKSYTQLYSRQIRNSTHKLITWEQTQRGVPVLNEYPCLSHHLEICPVTGRMLTLRPPNLPLPFYRGALNAALMYNVVRTGLYAMVRASEVSVYHTPAYRNAWNYRAGWHRGYPLDRSISQKVDICGAVSESAQSSGAEH